MPSFGTYGYLDSFRLDVGPTGTSDEFPVPRGFVGHVYIRPSLGDRQAIFVIGCDGNGNCSALGGFAEKVKTRGMDGVSIKPAQNLNLQVFDLPNGVVWINVALVGAVESLP